MGDALPRAAYPVPSELKGRRGADLHDVEQADDEDSLWQPTA